VDDCGFTGPKFDRNGGCTSIYYVKNTVGIEINIEWFYAIPSILLVRLSNGKIPKRGMVLNGKICRKFLQTIIYEQKMDRCANFSLDWT